MADPRDDDATYLSGPVVPGMAGTGPGATAPTAEPSPGEAASSDAPRLRPGQDFGSYRIERLLGRGGMGEVYEATHRAHGRRVALKVLSQRLASDADRARFLREGQLAASLSHPHTVYVFGSEEIDGTAVIAMELVPGGTLKDRVERDGPMAPTAAVDATLQIVAGLAAAHACGILHRDVKPANCFVDDRGAVKVGDFGLSIPAVATDVTQRVDPAGFQGTPQFAAPEQLRGLPLDARADIYAVGATLYYLLTGHPPFDDRELMTLLTRIATDTPAPPTQPGVVIPRGLSAVMLACLAKDPAARPPSYADLDARLRPFGSDAPTPAGPGLRLAAGIIDYLILFVATAPLGLVPLLTLSENNNLSASVGFAQPGSGDAPIWTAVAVVIVSLLYYGLLEGLGGASVGKRVCGLMVTSISGDNVTIARAVLRAVIFVAPRWLPYVRPELALALLFVTVRPRNGWATVHDLVTRTRVIIRRRVDARAPLAGGVPVTAASPEPAMPGRAGAFTIAGRLSSDVEGELLLASDAALMRPVWIRMVPPGTPALGTERRELGRPGRLRWMDGRRGEDESWDAFEAPDGAPFLSVVATPQPWPIVKRWLADLAREVAAASQDGTMPTLALDRAWITRANTAKLLDFPAPGTSEAKADAGARETCRGPQPFLGAVAARALGLSTARAPSAATAAEAPALPARARPTIDVLARGGCATIDEAAARVTELESGQDTVTRLRRGAAVVLGNWLLALTLVGMAVVTPTLQRVLEPGFLPMVQCLGELRDAKNTADPSAAAKRRGYEAYLAGTFGSTLADDRTWTDVRTRAFIAQLRPAARAALAGGPAKDAAEGRLAAEAARECNTDMEIGHGGVARVASIVPAAVLLATAFGALVGAFLFRGPLLLRLLGLAVVTRDGRLAGRFRATWRSAIAWSPTLVLWIGIVVLAARGDADLMDLFANPWITPVLLMVSAAGAWATVREPGRGPADRLAGTFVVPR